MKTVAEAKAKTPKSVPTPDMTDVTQILHHDHQTVAELFFQFSELEKENHTEKNKLASKIIKELFMHAKAEEELVYPAVRKADSDSEDMMDEADTEHHVVKFLMAELSEMKAGDDHFDSKICVLGELVNHHVQEEEKEIFEALRDSDIDLDALGEKFLKRKEELTEEDMPVGTNIVTNSRNGAKKKK
jgi:hemerythrin superfamily protein